MSVEGFEEKNTAYLQESWLENNPEFAYMLNDWDFSRYIDDINYDDLIDIMAELYVEHLDNNL